MQRTQILVIASDDELAARIDRGLRDLGDYHRLSRVTRLDEAAVWLDWNSANAILIDPDLPDSSAPESLRAALAAAEGAPVIVLTESTDPGDAKASLDLGARDVLVTRDLAEVALRRISGYARAHGQEARLRELEEELARSRVLISVAPTRAPDAPPLSQRDPECFSGLCERYMDLLDEYLNYMVGGRRKPLDTIEQLAVRFVDRWASPWDLAEVHTAAVENLARGRTAERAQALISESRLMALELMGELAAHYRGRAQVFDARSGERAGPDDS